MKKCPYIKHKIGEDDDEWCYGISFKEFDGMTACEYKQFIQQSYLSYKVPTNKDGLVLRTTKHPVTFKWWFKSLLRFFRRPKFSKEALEHAEKIKVCLCPMHSAFKPVEAHNASCEWECSAPERHLHKPIPFEANDMMEEKVKIKTGMGYKIKVVPSPRIDYCGACKKEHGFDCPLDEK